MRRKRVLSLGAWALSGCIVVMRAGEWLVTSVSNHVGTSDPTWYEIVITGVGILMWASGFVLAAATLLGRFDES